MPWNDNPDPGAKPGPKGGKKPESEAGAPRPKPSPWGAPPSGGGDRGGSEAPRPGPRPGGSRQIPPELGDLSSKLRARMRDYFGGGTGPGGFNVRGIGAVAGGLVGLWLISGFYVVQPNEQAVITTLGAYTGWNGPGFHYRLPDPIQHVEKVPVTTLQRLDVGGREGSENLEESLMLTGDENIVDLDFTVQWRVAQASKYLFNLRDPNDAIKAVAESAMREVVGRTPLQPILTTGRGEVQRQTAQLMQRVLDSYDAGVYINEVQIRNASPPPKVVEAFREVATAGQNAESAVNRARGEAASIVQSAIGYRAQVTQEAAGEAARFNQVYEQYRLAPAVTRERLYIETMERVLKNANKVVIDAKGATAPIVLPPDVFRSRTQTAPTQTVQPTPGAAR